MPRTSRLCPKCRRIYDGDTLFCPRDGARLEEGQRILAGKFIFGKELGRGNMGAVYEADQPAMNRKVAVKLLHPDLTRDPAMVERFEREAQAAGRVRHENVVTVYDCGSDEGQVYLAMELLSGESLAQRLADKGRLPPEEALPLWLPVVAAMAEAHREGVVHRDLKPENLFVEHRRDGRERIKVLDFGIARLVEAHKNARGTLEGTVLGTLLYMAPEQLDGKVVGPAADVYALGLILCEMLTGRLPWGRRDVDLPGVHLLRLNQPPRPLAELCPEQPFPPALQALLDATLDRDPDRRIKDAAELEGRARELLDRCPRPFRLSPSMPAEERAQSPPRALLPTPGPAPSPLPGRSLLAPAGIAGGAALLLVGVLVVRSPGPPRLPQGPDLAAAPDLAPSHDLASARPQPDLAPPQAPPAPGPRMVALEFQIATPLDRAVKITCQGGKTCTSTGGTCKVAVRADTRCACTATTRAYTPMVYRCPGLPQKGQRIRIQLVPERF